MKRMKRIMSTTGQSSATARAAPVEQKKSVDRRKPGTLGKVARMR